MYGRDKVDTRQICSAQLILIIEENEQQWLTNDISHILESNSDLFNPYITFVSFILYLWSRHRFT